MVRQREYAPEKQFLIRAVHVYAVKSVFLILLIRLRAMDAPRGVMGRRIDRRKLQRALSGVQNIVPCAAWHKDGLPRAEASLEIQLFPAISHADKRFSLFYTDELIRVGVDLRANLAAGDNTH